MKHYFMDKFLFAVEPFADDVNGRLSWNVLGNELLRVANLSASNHHFGFERVKAVRYAWVLSRLVIEVDEMPQTGNQYNIYTWVSRVYSKFTDRLFALTYPEGKSWGYAHSVWALIDFETRQSVDIEHMAGGAIMKVIEQDTIPISAASRLRVKASEPIRTIRVTYSDLDVNGHVNSISYLQKTLDTLYECFPKQVEYSKHGVKRIELSFSHESYFGDKLSFFVDTSEDGVYDVDIRRGEGITAAKVKVFFTNL